MIRLFVFCCALLEAVSQGFAEISTQIPTKFWKCPINNHNQCVCIPSKSGGFTLQCPIPEYEHDMLTAQYAIEEEHGISSFTIECPCNKTKPLTAESLYSYLKGIPLKNISELKFDYCPIPLQRFSTFLGGQFNLSFIQHLSLTSCKPIPTPFHDLLQNLSHLAYLNLRNNDMKYLPDNFLDDQLNLKTLILDQNKLENITGKIFRSLQQLKRLQLGLNRIKLVEIGAFSNLKVLVQLNLQNNLLYELPSNIFDSLANLKFMDLSQNNLLTLEKNIFKFNTNLTELYIRKNSFELLPSGLFSHNQKLRDLSLQSNTKLSTIPLDIFGNLLLLKNLDLSSCRFNESSFDGRTFENLTQLTTLNLARNQIRKLNPDWFAGLANLKSLDISSNQLISIEDNIFRGLPVLSTLKLNGNNIVNLQNNAFKGLVVLKKIFLQDNQLEFLDPEAMTDLKELTHINLGQNKLKFNEGLVNPIDGWRQSPLRNSKKLEQIDLVGNRLEELFSDWWYMPSLTHLNLKQNLFSSLTLNDLTNFKQSRLTIDISRNKIKHFFNFDVASMIDENEGIKKLILDGNPLVCDCETYSLAQYMNRTLPGVKHSWIIDSPNLLCEEPASLAGIPPSAIDPSLLICKCEGNYSPCGCYKRPSDKMLLFECQEQNLTKLPSLIPSYPGYGIQMNLSSNWIDIGDELSDSLNNVTSLDLSHNGMDSSKLGSLGWPQQLHRRFPELKRLDLSYNNFSSISSGVVEALNQTSNLIFLLSGNPWICDCSNLALVKFIYGSWKRIEDFNRMICSNGLLISDLSVDKVCPSVNIVSKYLAIAMPLMALVIFCVFLLIYRSRRTILAWLYSRRLCLRCVVNEDDEEHDDRKYDAFISFSHLDEDFVIQELVPQLECPPPGLPDYRLCLHYRDW